MIRFVLLLAAALGLGFVLTAGLALVSPISQAVVAVPPVSKGVAIGLITLGLTVAYVLATAWAGAWRGVSLICLGYVLLILDKWLFGGFDGIRVLGGIVWSVGFWYGLAVVDYLWRKYETYKETPAALGKTHYVRRP